MLVAAPPLTTAVPAYAVTNVSASGSVLDIESGEASDNLTITAEASGGFTVRNTADTLAPGTGCRTVDAHTVRCTGTGISGISVKTWGGDDTVRNDTALTSAALLGSGADTYIGGSARDVAVGGPGPDTLNGGGGPDVLIGAEGIDSADGGPGGDLCLTEVRTRCEI